MYKKIACIIGILGGIAGFAYLFYVIGYNIGENKSPNKEDKSNIQMLEQKIDSLTFTPQRIEFREGEAKSISRGEILLTLKDRGIYTSYFNVVGADSISGSHGDQLYGRTGDRAIIKSKNDIYIVNFLSAGKEPVIIEIIKEQK